MASDKNKEGPRLLNHLFGAYDTMQSHADVLGRKNRILNDQKVAYERTVDMLRKELNDRDKDRAQHRVQASKEITHLSHERQTLQERVAMTHKEKEKYKTKIRQMSKDYEALQAKHEDLLLEMKKKVETMNSAYSKLGTKYKEVLSQMNDKIDLKDHDHQIHRMKELYGVLEEKYRQLEEESEKKIELSRHDAVVKEMNDFKTILEKKYKDAVDKMDHMIEKPFHEDQVDNLKRDLDELKRCKTDELNIVSNANSILTTRIEALKTENERLLKENRIAMSSESPDKIRIKFLETELSEVRSRLSANEQKLKKIGDNEAIYRRTLSQIIRVSERTTIDRDCLAVIIRQQRVKQDSLLDPLSYRHFINDDLDQIQNLLGLEHVETSANGLMSFECRHCKRFKLDKEGVECMSV